MAAPAGPINRTLDAHIVQALIDLTRANPTNDPNDLQISFENAKRLAQTILDAPTPTHDDANELDDLRREHMCTQTERDAVRRDAANYQRQVGKLTTQLDNALAMGAAQSRKEGNGGGHSGGFPDAPTFDGTKPEELRTWTLQLRSKLAAQAARYPTEPARLRYALNRLSGSALNLVRSHVSEETGDIDFASLNDLLDILRQAYDDPDRTRTAEREITRLRQKNQPFSTYYRPGLSSSVKQYVQFCPKCIKNKTVTPTSHSTLYGTPLCAIPLPPKRILDDTQTLVTISSAAE